MEANIEKQSVRHLCRNKSIDEGEFSKSNPIKGIYLWGYQNDDKQFIPLYVGKAGNIYERIIQHYCRFMGGEYCIPNLIFRNSTSNKPCCIERSKMYMPTDLAIVYGLHNTENGYKKNKEYIISNFSFIILKLSEKGEKEIGEKYLGEKVGIECLISSVPFLDVALDKEIKSKIDSVFGEYYKPII